MSYTDAAASARLIWPISLFRWRYTRQLAPWISALFFLGLFVDYGGGFYIKYLVSILAVVWVVTQRHSPTILRKCKFDLLIFFGIPLALGMIHVLVTAITTGAIHLKDLYYTLSSSLLLILLPLFYQIGGTRVMGQLRTGFRVVALIIVIIGSLHVLGIINIHSDLGWMQEKEIGRFATDPRKDEKIDISKRGLVNIRIGHALPLAFGMELTKSWFWSAVIALAPILMMARGLLVGMILALFLSLILYRHRRKKIRFAKVVKVGVLLLVTIVLITLFPSQIHKIDSLISYNLEEIFTRINQARALEDSSLWDRLGQIQGYVSLLDENPLILLVGTGPVWVLQTPFQPTISQSEISVLNITLWYGLPYMLLYCSWLFFGVWQLWRLRRHPEYQSLDTGFLVGAISFWISGMFNPILNSPMGIVAFMVVRTRTLELSGCWPGTITPPRAI